MRQHFVYIITRDAPAPAAGFDMGSWFDYYKWNVEGETFVPITGDARLEFLQAKEGDWLWFIVDGMVLGCVVILRVEDEASQRKVEVWYDTSSKMLIHRSTPSYRIGSGAISGDEPLYWTHRIENTGLLP